MKYLVRAPESYEIHMATPFLEEREIRTKNNESVLKLIRFVTRQDGLLVPVDLTGKEFFAQARRAKHKDSELMCNLTAQIFGDPEQGTIAVSVSHNVLKTVYPGRGFWDILTRSSINGNVNNIFIAPFIVEGGASNPDDWN